MALWLRKCTAATGRPKASGSNPSTRAGSTSSHRQIFVKFARSGIWPFSTLDRVAGDRPISRAVARIPTFPRFRATIWPSDLSDGSSVMLFRLFPKWLTRETDGFKIEPSHGWHTLRIPGPAGKSETRQTSKPREEGIAMNDKDDAAHVADSGTDTPTGDGSVTEGPGHLTMRIDRKKYRVPPELLERGTLTGRQIRRLVQPGIGRDRDLYEVVPGGSDVKIGYEDRVRIRNHMRFFSAPAVINPGSVCDRATARLWATGSEKEGRRRAPW